MRRRLVPISAVAALASLATAPPVQAKIMEAAVGPGVRVAAGGSILFISGRYRCLAGERFNLRVTVFQADFGTLGQGRFRGACTSKPQRFTVRVEIRGTRATPFRKGFARACSFGITRHGELFTDLRSWCNGLTVK